jgi:PAS domain S-box-containing protein
MGYSSDGKVPETLRKIADILENISDGLFALDPEWRFIYLNGRAEKILHTTAASVLEKDFWDVFPELRETVFEAEFRRALVDQKATRFEAFCAPIQAWLSVSAHPAPEGIAIYASDISDTRQAQEALRVSEARFRSMVDRLTIGAVFREGDFVWLNRAAEGLLGYTHDELSTIDDWFRLTHRGDAQAARARYEGYRAAGFPEIKRTALTTKQDTILHVQMAAYIDDWSEMWILSDITERLLTEEKFRVLFEHSDTAFFLFGATGVVDCNAAALDQLGLAEKSQVIGRRFASMSPEVQSDGQSSDDKLLKINQEIAVHGKHSFEWEHFRSDGSIASVYVSVSKFVVDDQSLELVVWRDLSEIKKAEDKLRQSEDRYRTILDHTNEIIYTLSLDGLFTYVSPSWTRQLGHPVDQVVGKAFIDFVHPDDVIKGKVYTYRLFKDPNHRGSCVYRAMHADGSFRWHETSGSVVLGADGNPIHFVGLSHDVGEKRQAKAALEEARDEALASSRAKSQFLATVSHEIRTPLNGVLGMTNLLADTSLTNEQRSYLNTIQSSGEILRRVIDDVLDFSRIEAGKLTITPMAVEVVAAIQDVVSLFEGRAMEKGIALGVDWRGLQSLHVYADQARVKQVVANLIANAVKFTDNGGVQVIGTLVRETNTAVLLRIEVIDTGIGILPDRVDAIFEGFTQADNSMVRRYGGSGLGLTISKRLTDLMGGKIGVESQPGAGSRFWVELPLSRITAAIAKQVAEHRSVSLEGVRVLLAEDNDVNVLVAKQQIELLGCVVDVAANGKQAVEMSFQSEYKMILMDIQMPEMDGLEATRAIRAREQEIGGHIPIIALTATAFAEDKKACEEAGMDSFLSKPFRRDDLERLLKQFASDAPI